MNIDNTQLPTVKVRDTHKDREINTKTGKKTVYFQPVQVECEQFRVNIDMDIDGPADALPVGSVHRWNVLADLVPGAFSSIDLSRRMTLIPADTAAKKVA
jgi:hypothetical protein